MKAELKLMPHDVLKEPFRKHNCVEVWWQGKLIGMVYGADGPGIRFMSKYNMKVVEPATPDDVSKMVKILEIFTTYGN